MTVETTAPHEAQTEVLLRPASAGWSAVPRVNLLPPEIIEQRRFRKVQIGLGTTLVATLGIAAGAFLWAQSGVQDAEDRLAATQTRTAQLQNEQRQYAEVPEILTRLQAAEEARQTAMANDVLWHQVLDDVARAAGSTVQVSQIQATLTTVAQADPAAGAIAPAGIGTVTFSGSAGAYRDVSAWIEAVEELTGFDASGLTSATQDDVSATAPAGQTDAATDAGGGGQGGGPVTFTTDASITDGALSHRYDRKAG